ncbi:transposase [Actinophytocola algeriensis]|uniref:Transposase/copper chaperone CopZ n=1 Tax=Actinophytocola algeriensis TaxID=1768010 RepID=A0A7W7VGA0_9PSEU|nr:transposase [Actinophytocola algeriensis]MBB4908865.1 transposase/copper chaperone CopZ [Actinophytocola algeriensis]MBE1474747.1 transposase/copper chaperone CopZ [Actinophytocola algeriensis]
MVETATHIFHIKNMHCDDCATLIDDTLRALPGVHNARATYETREVRVELDPRRTSPESMTAAITDLGFQIKPPTAPKTRSAKPIEPQISDSTWQLLAPLLGDATPRGRHLFEGIAYKHRHCLPWREVPTSYGPWQTLYARLARWRSDGTWTKVTEAAQHSAFADELAWVKCARD